MDTFRQVEDGSTSKSESLGAPQRQQRSIAEKRRIVEETLVEGASVARVARVHGINANQVLAGVGCTEQEGLGSASRR
jgi:transposase-like protein